MKSGGSVVVVSATTLFSAFLDSFGMYLTGIEDQTEKVHFMFENFEIFCSGRELERDFP